MGLLSTVLDEGDSSHLNLTQVWAYDSQCRKIKYKDSCQTDPGGKAHITFYSYTDSNNPNQVTKLVDAENADGNPPSGGCPGCVYTYDSSGNELSEVTPQGRETDYAYYSGTNRLYTTTLKDKDRNGNSVNRVTTYTYYGSTKGYQVDTVTDACSNVTTYDYSTTTGYRISMTPQVGNATSYGSDDMGDVTSVTDGNNNTTSYQYDNIHRLTQITYPDVGNGQKTRTTTWTCCGKTSETDEDGVVTKYYYDEDQTPAVHDHRLWKVVQDYGTGTLNYTTQYGYDEVGNNTTVINPRGYTTTYTYDAGNRKTGASYPDSTSESWTYADNGRVWTHTDGRGRVVTYRYDADNRLCGPYSSGYKAVTYPNDTPVYITRDEDGLVTELRDDSGTTTNTYYPSQRLNTVTVSAGASKTLTYDYTGVGLISYLAISGETGTFSYTYDGDNRLSTVTNPNSVQVSFSYDNGGRRTYITDPGSYVQYLYNARNWLTGVYNRTTGGVSIYNFCYCYGSGSTWDNCGNPLMRVDLTNGTQYITTLSYDHLHRETAETKKDSGNNTIYALSYGYDACGNRTTRTLGGVTYTYSYDNNNKMSSASGGGLSASFGYDNNGNMTSVSGTMYGSKSMVYNDSNYLTSITYSGTTDNYWYTSDGLRYKATLAGTTTCYLYSGQRVLEEEDTSGNMQARYTTEDDSYFRPLLHMYRSSGSLSRFPMYDSIGSVRGLVDATATVTDTYELDSFGRLNSSSGTTPNSYRFGGAWGYMTDPSGMLQLGERHYWPELGRFLQQDPPGKEDNAYAYAGSEPLTSVDPDGNNSRKGGKGGRGRPKKNSTPNKPRKRPHCPTPWAAYNAKCGNRLDGDIADCNADYSGWNTVAGGGTTTAGAITTVGGTVVWWSAGIIVIGVGAGIAYYDATGYQHCLERAEQRYNQCLNRELP